MNSVTDTHSRLFRLFRLRSIQHNMITIIILNQLELTNLNALINRNNKSSQESADLFKNNDTISTDFLAAALRINDKCEKVRNFKLNLSYISFCTMKLRRFWYLPVVKLLIFFCRDRFLFVFRLSSFFLINYWLHASNWYSISADSKSHNESWGTVVRFW